MHLHSKKLISLIYKDYHIFVFLLVSILSLFTYGISNSSYKIYILSPIIEIKKNLNINFFNIFFLSEFSIQRYFFILFEEILRNKFYYTFLTILLKFFYFFILYKILINFINSQKLSFIFSLVFISAPTYYSHGMIVNGAWSAHMLINASISFALTLVSFYFIINKKIISSTIFTCFSLFFHPLYAIQFIFFLLFMICIIKINLRKKIFSFLFILFSILYMKSLGDSALTDNFQNISTKYWFWQTFYLNTNDFSFLNNLLDYNFYLVISSLISLNLIINNFKANNGITFLEKSVLFSIFFNFIIICIELLHLSNFFIPLLSEFFIQLQFRRGVWISYLITNIYIFQNIKDLTKKYYNFRSQLLVIIFLLNLLIPTFLMTAITSILLFKENVIRSFKNLIFILMVIILFFIVGQDSIAQNLGKYQILIITFISMLFYFIYLNYKDNTNLIVISILLALCFYSFME